MNTWVGNGWLQGKPQMKTDTNGRQVVRFFLAAYSQAYNRLETIPCELAFDVAKFQGLVSPNCYIELSGPLIFKDRINKKTGEKDKILLVLVEQFKVVPPKGEPYYLRDNFFEKTTPKRVTFTYDDDKEE